MTAGNPDPAGRSVVDLRVARASAVAVHHLPPGTADWFLDWQRGLAAAARDFPGYHGATVYPPPGGDAGDWIAVLHFDDDDAMRAWIASPLRAEWLKKFEAGPVKFDLTTLPGGFGAWFAGQARGAVPPPGWKMALTVVLGLYPTVMLLNLTVGRYTAPLGFAAAMLVGNVLSVCLLQWAVMPLLTRAAARWLRPAPRHAAAVTAAGLVVVLGLLAGLVVVFRAVS